MVYALLLSLPISIFLNFCFLLVLVLCCFHTDKSLANQDRPPCLSITQPNMRNTSLWSDFVHSHPHIVSVELSQAVSGLVSKTDELRGIINHFKGLYVSFVNYLHLSGECWMHPVLFQVHNVFHESNYDLQHQRYNDLSFPWLIPPRFTSYLIDPLATWSRILVSDFLVEC